MNLKELASELNISTTTVSRVLTGQEKKYRISEKTSKKVKDLAKSHGFKPNQIARNLRLQRTNTIGLIIPDISNTFFANLARTVEVELRKKNKMVLLCDTKDETTIEQESMDLLLGRKVDGLLVAPVGKKWEHLNKNINIPVVLIDRYFQGNKIPFVATDNYCGSYEATSYLISKGHRYIACIQGLVNTSANTKRIDGFNKAIQDQKKLPIQTIILGNDYSVQNGYQSTKTLLQMKNIPTAIFALNNQITMGVMKAVHEAGLKIPEDISLLSFDDQPYFELLSPPISAIRQPIEAMGKKAVEILLGLIEGRNYPDSKLKPTLMERDSIKLISHHE